MAVSHGNNVIDSCLAGTVLITSHGDKPTRSDGDNGCQYKRAGCSRGSLSIDVCPAVLFSLDWALTHLGCGCGAILVTSITVALAGNPLIPEYNAGGCNMVVHFAKVRVRQQLQLASMMFSRVR